MQTDNMGAYAFNNLPARGSYIVTPQAAYVSGPTRLYANPGWVKLDNLSGPQTLNFVYNLTSPWTPPDPNPTPPPPPPPSGDGTLPNPGFDGGGEGWAASGAVSFTNSQARLTVRLAPQTAISQAAQVVPGAT